MTTRVVVTGAGGAAAVAFMKAVAHEDVEVHAADMDPLAAGRFMVPVSRRHLLPPGKDPAFAGRLLELCHRVDADVVVPTVDVELAAVARAARAFRAHDIVPVVASPHALSLCLDKAALMEAVGAPLAPRWAVLDDAFEASAWAFPIVVKPRSGAGGRGVRVLHDPSDLQGLPRDGSLLVQEYLPGDEYSVDVLLSPHEERWAAVPRTRQKVDSGVTVVGRTLRDPLLQDLATAACRAVGLTFVANVQLRRDQRGRPRLLEINPRFPGTMSLTVAAGVNMPALVLRMARDLAAGRYPKAPELRFAELGMVRTWHERFVTVGELEGSSALLRARQVA